MSKVLSVPGFDCNIAVKHTLANAKILRNIGIDIPAPISSSYAWPGKYSPFAHQRKMAEFMTMNPRCFNLSEPGTMKTAAAYWAADWMMNEGFVDKALILAPLSTLELVWMKDCFDVLMHRKVAVVHGDMDHRLKMLEANVDFYLLNHDGVKLGEIHRILRKRPDINLLIVDEGSKFRNASKKEGSKYRALERLIRPDLKVWWMTGTPCPNAPTDAWGQVRIVKPENVPEWFGQFRRKVMYDVGGSMGHSKWKPRPEGAAIAFKAMQPAIRFEKKDCLDLPPLVFENRTAGLTVEQKQAFKAMKDHMVATLEPGKAISAVNAADKIGKLRQILCGCIRVPGGDFAAKGWAATAIPSGQYEAKGEYVTIPHGPRFDVLLETMECASGKTIIVVPFKGITRSLAVELEKKGRSVAILNGDVSTNERNKIIRAFKSGPDPHDLICHPAVMSHGLNLVEADTTILYAPIYSNDEFLQLIERMNRAGQTRKMTVYRIGTHPLEWSIYNVVEERKVTQETILSLYKTAIESKL